MIELPKAKDKINPYIKVNFQKIHGVFLVQLNCCTKAAKFLNNNLMD